MRSNQLRSGSQFNANPCIVVQRDMRTPIAAIFCAPLPPPLPGTQTPERPAIWIALDAEIGAGRDQRQLEPPHVADRVDRHRQPHDRIPDQLARAVPGDPAATVDVDHRRAVDRPLEILGAATGGEDRRVLQQQAGVGDLVGHPLRRARRAAAPTPRRKGRRRGSEKRGNSQLPGYGSRARCALRGCGQRRRARPP